MVKIFKADFLKMVKMQLRSFGYILSPRCGSFFPWHQLIWYDALGTISNFFMAFSHQFMNIPVAMFNFE